MMKGREMKEKINEKLKEYIEETIFPEYQKNEKAHGIEHIQYVITRSFEIVEENALEVNSNMVYTIAAYHDIGHHINDEKHEEISAKMMCEDKKLSSFFSEEERKIMKEAIEDHRASAKKEPRNIYGKIVSSADRNTTVEQCLERSYVYGKKQKPEASNEELYERAFQVLTKKFGENGYAKFYFKDKKYENFLKEIRDLLQDKEKFITTQKMYIKNKNI